MPSKRIEAIVAEYEGAMFDHGAEGLLILNRAQKILHIPQSEKENGSWKDNAESFLQQKSEKIVPVPVSIGIEISELQNDRQHILFERLQRLNDGKHRIFLQIRFQFLTEGELTGLRQFIERCESLKINNRKCSLIGGFPLLTDQDKYFLFQNSFQLYFEHHIETILSDQDKKAVKSLTEFGFRIPFLWYVDDKSILRLQDDFIASAMRFNEYSGFAVLPKELPSKNYFNLLIFLYEKYPKFDAVFMPINFWYEQSVSVPFFGAVDFSDPVWELLARFWINAFVWQRWIAQRHTEHG